MDKIWNKKMTNKKLVIQTSKLRGINQQLSITISIDSETVR